MTDDSLPPEIRRALDTIRASVSGEPSDDEIIVESVLELARQCEHDCVPLSRAELFAQLIAFGAHAVAAHIGQAVEPVCAEGGGVYYRETGEACEPPPAVH